MFKKIVVIAVLLFLGFTSLLMAENFPRDFYKSHDIKDVIPALRSYAKQAESGRLNGKNIMPMVYAFARVAQMHPELIPEYKELAGRFKDAGFSLIVLALGKAGNLSSRQALADIKKEYPDKKDILAKAVSQSKAGPRELGPRVTPTDIDVLWVEFFLTGNPGNVNDIINVWLSDDIVAERISEHFRYYQGHPDQRLMDMLKRLDIEVSKDGEVISDEDLGLALLRRIKSRAASFQEKEKQQVARQLLYGLGLKDDSEEFQMLLAKDHAQWTLETNARSSDDVLAICEGFLPKAQGRKHKIALLHMLARIYADKPQSEVSRNKFMSYLNRLKGYTPDDPYIYYMEAQDCINRLDVACLDRQVIPLQRLSMDSYRQIQPLYEWIKEALSYEYLADSGEAVSIAFGDIVKANANRHTYRSDAILVNSERKIGDFGALEAVASIQFLPGAAAEIQGKLLQGEAYLFISCRKKQNDLYEVMGDKQALIPKNSANYESISNILDAFSIAGLLSNLQGASLLSAHNDGKKIVVRFRDSDSDLVTLWLDPKTLYINRFLVHNGSNNALRAVVRFWEGKGEGK